MGRGVGLRPPADAPAAKAVARAGVLLTAAAVAAQTLVHLVNRFTINRATLDANEEYGLWAWAAAGTTFTCAAACALLAALPAWRPDAFLALASTTAFLSLDEAIAIHERLGTNVAEALGASASWDSVIWPLLYLPVLAAAAALLVGCARAAPPAVRRLILLGLGALAAAVAAEAVSAPFSTPGTARDVPHALEGALEEALELGGWGLVATALFAWLAETPAAGVAGREPRQSTVK